MKEYQKTMLLLYPRLERYARDLGQYARAKAAASALGRESAEESIRTVLDCVYAQGCCEQLKALLDGVLGELTEEERLLVSYKYFRRGTAELGCSPRTYYRRQLRLESKLNARFLQRGMSERWFLHTFADVPAVRHVYERVCARQENELYDKRARCGLAFGGKR